MPEKPSASVFRARYSVRDLLEILGWPEWRRNELRTALKTAGALRCKGPGSKAWVYLGDVRKYPDLWNALLAMAEGVAHANAAENYARSEVKMPGTSSLKPDTDQW